VGYFFPEVLCINFGKNELGYSLGDFFANSFGHTEHKPSA
jgi:hypothetical protein